MANIEQFKIPEMSAYDKKDAEEYWSEYEAFENESYDDFLKFRTACHPFVHACIEFNFKFVIFSRQGDYVVFVRRSRKAVLYLLHLLFQFGYAIFAFFYFILLNFPILLIL